GGEDGGRRAGLRHVPGVNEAHGRAGAEGHALDLRGRREWRAWTVGERERGSRDRRDAREPPLLLLRGGEAQLDESRHRALADLLQPRRSGPGAVTRE